MVSLFSWTFGALAALDVFSVHGPPTASSFAASLSRNAEVYYPESEKLLKASTRWSAVTTPSFDAIVRVANEEDVQKTVCLTFS
jgi:hypothetical protein